jgi:hypothetical protein
MAKQNGSKNETRRDLARQQLDALIEVPGALKIITSEETKDGRGYPVTDPRHYVLHDVVRLEEIPSQPNQIRAWSAEGDYTQGSVAAVLRRLQQWADVPEE